MIQILFYFLFFFTWLITGLHKIQDFFELANARLRPAARNIGIQFVGFLDFYLKNSFCQDFTDGTSVYVHNSTQLTLTGNQVKNPGDCTEDNDI